MNSDYFTALLPAKLAVFDRQGTEQLCTELVNQLYQSNDSFPTKEAELLLQQLRNKRFFLLMQQVGDAFIQTGRSSPRIQRLYAHCLIEQGAVTAAIALLTDLATEVAASAGNQALAAKELVEVKGALARAYKQVYIQASGHGNTTAMACLNKVVQLTMEGYKTTSASRLWLGINAVAILCHAKKNGSDITPYNADPLQMARDILDEIQDLQDNKEAGIWDYAVAAEACIALGNYASALKWLDSYIGSKNSDGSYAADAFEVGSTLRQFKEVWQLDKEATNGVQIITLLQAALLQREGGSVAISIENVAAQQAAAETPGLEKVFGADSFETYNWYMQGADRCKAIARIGRDASKGFGTGFLLKGTDLHPSLGDDFVLLTNAHVLSDDITINALRKEEVCVVFEVLDRDESFGISELIFSSSPALLDVTIARFNQQDTARLKTLTQEVHSYPISKVLPLLSDTQRIYIIGHPGGGTLSMSLQDNLLLDYQVPLIHYRTPTIGGSSGSPVFNRQWQLIGIHHKGASNMPMLNGKQGFYEANEGISITTIIDELSKALATTPQQEAQKV